MTPLQRLHDQLVTTEGIECTCQRWGASWCPATVEATRRTKHQQHTGQLSLTDSPGRPDSYNQLPDDY